MRTHRQPYSKSLPPSGDRRPCVEPAFLKCYGCGATMKTALDFTLHTNASGECLALDHGQRPRADRLQAAAPGTDS